MEMWQICREFVAKTCKGRDSSHGLEHMEEVTKLALVIHSLNPPPREKLLEININRIVLVAMLHDVADHKYDKDGSLEKQVTDFVYSVEPFEGKMVMDTIRSISFSKENRLGKRYFENTLGVYWTSIRDIVSDADKILAIGQEGIERCRSYIYEQNPDLPLSEVHKKFEEHAEEKLLRLYPEFIVTPGGKFLAEPKHQEVYDYMYKV